MIDSRWFIGALLCIMQVLCLLCWEVGRMNPKSSAVVHSGSYKVRVEYSDIVDDKKETVE